MSVTRKGGEGRLRAGGKVRNDEHLRRERARARGNDSKEGPKAERGPRCKGAKQERDRPQRGATARSELRVQSSTSYE